MTRVGVVAALNRYPVKSMMAEPMQGAALHWTGLQGDRTYAFVRESDRSDFPWLTARQVPAMVRHEALYTDPDPKHATVQVRAPNGTVYDVRDPALAAHLSEQAGQPVRLVRIGRGTYDAMPVSVLTDAQVAAVGAAHGTPVGAERFRANILVAAAPDAPPEREWAGRELRFGTEARVRLDWAIPRCAMVAIDPDTADRDPEVLRTVVQAFGNRVGTYCAVTAPGPIAVGDPVTLA